MHQEHGIPDVMPVSFDSPSLGADQAPASVEERKAPTTEMFTPKVILISSFIAVAIIVVLWVAGSHADTLTHKRVTGEDITTWESMFNGTAPGKPATK
jgi:hypothetical protein